MKQVLINREPFEISETGLLATMKDGAVVPFNGHRCRVWIDLQETNVLKDDLSMPKGIYKATDVRIFFNDMQVYGFRSDTAEIALSLALNYLLRFRALPVDLSSREAIEQRLIGQKVDYGLVPMVVDDFDGVTGTVRLRYETKPRSGGITTEFRPMKRVDILSNEILWHRDEVAA